MTKDRVLLLLSLLLALLLWIPQKLTKTYKHKIPIKLTVEVPENRQIKGDAILTYPIEIWGSGSKLIRLDGTIKRDTLLLPYTGQELSKEFIDSEIIPIIRSTYHISPEISIRPELSQLIFEFDSIMTKVVPIESHLKVTYASGFGQIGKIKLEPEEVTVKGPHEIVSAIKHIPTAQMEFNNISKTTTSEILITTPDNRIDVHLSTQNITATITVDQLTEKELLVPLDEIVANGKSWKLFPDKILVKLSVPIRMHQEIKPSDIKLSILPQGSQAVSVSVTGVPADVVYISHAPKIVRYFEE